MGHLYINVAPPQFLNAAEKICCAAIHKSAARVRNVYPPILQKTGANK
jgi:hypothetical protein